MTTGDIALFIIGVALALAIASLIAEDLGRWFDH